MNVTISPLVHDRTPRETVNGHSLDLNSELLMVVEFVLRMNSRLEAESGVIQSITMRAPIIHKAIFKYLFIVDSSASKCVKGLYKGPISCDF